MGWSSATDIFDGAVDVAIEWSEAMAGLEMPVAFKRDLIEAMYRNVQWDDWDTQNESKYYQDYLIHIMYKLYEIDEESYQEYFES